MPEKGGSLEVDNLMGPEWCVEHRAYKCGKGGLVPPC